MKSKCFVLDASAQRVCTDDTFDNFSRGSFFNGILQGENVKLLMLSTFRLDLAQLQSDFPHIFACDQNSVSTLVFHGDKDTFASISMGGDISTISRVEKNDQTECDSSEEEAFHSRHSWLRGCATTSKSYSFDNRRTAIYEVLPQWSCGGAGSAIPGVHHPKYMLIFTDRGLHVVISTANITEQRSADIAWCQFFPRLTASVGAAAQIGSTATDSSEFGAVLEDFLRKQAEQITLRDSGLDFHTVSQSGESWPRCGGAAAELAGLVMQRVLLEAGAEQGLIQHFDFSGAEVDLVSVVPGRDPLSALVEVERNRLYTLSGRDRDLVAAVPCKKCAAKHKKLRQSSTVRYGLTRIKSLLQRRNSLLYRSLTAEDVLVVQPTSIGAHIDNYYIDHMLAHYMCEDGWDQQYDTFRQECWRLVWPTKECITRLSSQAAPLDSLQRCRTDPLDIDGVENGCGLFLHPRSFAQMEFDIHAQFVTYAANQAPRVRAISCRHPPHAKTYARVMAGRQNCRELASELTCCTRAAVTSSRFAITEMTFQEKNQSTSATRADSLAVHIGAEWRAEWECDTSTTECSSHCVAEECLGVDSGVSVVSGVRSDAGDAEAKECAEVKVERCEEKDQVAADDTDSCTCADLAWCLLTSACLSKGAQGHEVPFTVCGDCGNIQQGFVEVRNFELGVLFHSRPGRQYRALSSTCPLHSNNSTSKSANSDADKEESIVVLPFPYEVLGGEPYCAENGDYLHRPYFHENREANKYGGNQLLPDAPIVTRTESPVRRCYSANHAIGSSNRSHASFLGKRASTESEAGTSRQLQQYVPRGLQSPSLELQPAVSVSGDVRVQRVTFKEEVSITSSFAGPISATEFMC